MSEEESPEERRPKASERNARLYRPSAWEALRRGNDLGSPLRLDSSALNRIFHASVFALLLTLAIALLVPLNDSARGRGFVHVVGSRNVTSVADGPIERVLLPVGAHVAPGDAVVTQYSADQRSDLDRLTREFETLWVRVLRDPLDLDARQGLALTLPAMRRAEAVLAERTARAPIEGTVSAIRVSEGIHVAKGETLFEITPANAPVEVVGVFPAAYRAHAALGVAGRFWVDGADRNVSMRVSYIQPDATGPAELARLLGPSAKGVNFGEGMSFVIKGSLSDATFVADGRERQFFSGMAGDVDLTLGKRPLLFLLLPTLRRIVYR
jgi:hypothetical protein